MSSNSGIEYTNDVFIQHVFMELGNTTHDHRLGCIPMRCNILLNQPLEEMRVEDMACSFMARDHRQLCYPVIAMHSIHITGSHSEIGTIRCPYMYYRISDEMRVNMAWVALF